jgi:hypothetical protein
VALPCIQVKRGAAVANLILHRLGKSGVVADNKGSLSYDGINVVGASEN